MHRSKFNPVQIFVLMASLACPTVSRAADSDSDALDFDLRTLELNLRTQVPVSETSLEFHQVEQSQSWPAKQTAVIVCDMWDAHHCVNAVRRVGELSPRIDAFCKSIRLRGGTIIHAPSGCLSAYEGHPARTRAMNVPPSAELPKDIRSWCDQIPTEEQAAYPIDQSDGGEDDDPVEHELWAQRLKASGRDPGAPWTKQTAAIEIDGGRDFVSDRGDEIWSILEQQNIENVMLVGVHTNMCVLGRPFGLRRLAQAGKNVVLVRDLTDTMYNPKAWPYVNHFTGTDLIVRHVERFVCPTISSEQVLGGTAFRFRADRRAKLLMLIAEDEYETESTLPAFAAKHLGEHFQVSFAYGNAAERHEIVGLAAVSQADALLVSVRRRALPKQDMQLIRQYVASGKPVIGIRTASHAFSLRGKPTPDGKAVWDSFDADVFGGNYTNHFGNELRSELGEPPEDSQPGGVHPIASATDINAIHPGGSLYKTAPLAEGTHALVFGSVPGEEPEPVAWTFVRNDGGRSFYTSLGHKDDFAQPAFESMLAAGIHWACGFEPHSLEEVSLQSQRHAAGSGKQR